ncbi:MAG: TIGR04282 family arsenosugar biosynthesis glycosyltransferase [Acidobacteria bacterium]|nr:TIGR04282 family arsenosugar biosynthesis glycosyltransferase [Acidobacteriota bacterium]
MQKREAALVLFARHPAGGVKTRLVPPLTPEEARRFHLACLESTIRLAAALPGSIGRWLYLTPPPRGRRHRRLLLRLGRGVRVRHQRGRDLGARLQVALRELRAQGCRRVVLIGSDSPTLPPAYLRRAFAALHRVDAVLGPARDGGCYLIGLQPHRVDASHVFSGIAWGTRRVFRQTRARLRKGGNSLLVLPPWDDVDVPADLVRLRRELQRSRRTQLEPLRAWASAVPTPEA